MKEDADGSLSEPWQGQGAGCGVECAEADLSGGTIPSPGGSEDGPFLQLAFPWETASNLLVQHGHGWQHCKENVEA